MWLWEWGGNRGSISPLYFPAPSIILNTLIRQLADGSLAGHLLATITRLFSGVFVGGLAGLGLGLSMGWSRRLRLLLDPLVAAIHPIPKIAVFPLILIILGLGEASKVLVIAIAAFFPILINSMAGVRQIHPVHFEVAQCYGASRWRIFTRLVWPGSLSLVLAGMRLALNTALLVTIAVELVSARQGLGAQIWLARETLRTEEIYAALLVISLLGMLTNFLLQHLSARLAPWQVERSI